MKKLFTVLLSLAMLAIPASLFAGCGPASGSDTIVFAIGSDWGSLDPYTSTNSMTGHYLTVDKIYDKLVYIDEEGKVSPRAAKSWTLADDGMSLTIALDENAKWHDGEPVTADDWIWTIEYMVSPTTAQHGFGKYLRGVDPETGVALQYAEGAAEGEEAALGAEKEGDHTLKLTFNQAINDVDQWFVSATTTVCVLPEHLLSDNAFADVMNDSFFSLPVGSGPCIVESIEAGNNIVLRANEAYQLGAPGFDKLIIQYRSSDTWVPGIAAGDIDVCQNTLTPIAVSGYENNGNVKMRALGDTVDSGLNLMINCSQVPRKIRQAIDRSIDKERIADVLFVGKAEASYSLVLPGNEYYAEGIGGRNVEQARQLVEEAIGDGVWTADKVLNIYYNGTNNEPVAKQVESDLTAIGLKVSVKTGETNTINAQMFADTPGYECQIVNLGTTAELPTKQLVTFLEAYDSYSHTHIFKAESKPGFEADYNTFLALYGKMTSATDLAETVKAFQEWEYENVPQSELTTYQTVEVTSMRVSGIDTFASSYYNMATWEWAVV